MEAKPRLRFRKLRIAWSVGWGTIAVLLCVLWVRSYWWVDGIEGMLRRYRIVLTSENARLRFATENYTNLPADTPWRRFTGPVLPGRARVGVPHLIAILILSAFAAAPWLRQWKWRFSLRTLLIATTLVAVGLGLIVWAVRK